MYNPYQPYNPYAQMMRQAQPPQTVTQVAGIESARQMALPPNSSAFALDYDNEHVYYVYTDGAGVAKADAYRLVPCSEESRQYVTREQFDELKGAFDEYVSKSGRAAHAAEPSGDAAGAGESRPR